MRLRLSRRRPRCRVSDCRARATHAIEWLVGDVTTVHACDHHAQAFRKSLPVITEHDDARGYRRIAWEAWGTDWWRVPPPAA